MTLRLAIAWSVVLAAATGPASACDCVEPELAFIEAQHLVVAHVVQLELRSLNEGDEDSPARDDLATGRAVVIEAVRGAAPRAVRFSLEPSGMCPVSAPELGEVLVFALDAIDETRAIRYCDTPLTLGLHWSGWDEGSLPLREALSLRPDAVDEKARDVIRRFVREPIPPPPPPPVVCSPAAI